MTNDEPCADCGFVPWTPPSLDRLAEVARMAYATGREGDEPWHISPALSGLEDAWSAVLSECPRPQSDIVKEYPDWWDDERERQEQKQRSRRRRLLR